MNMTKSREYCDFQSKLAESPEGQHRHPKPKDKRPRTNQPMAHNSVLLILSALVPICLTICVLAVGMSKGQVMVNLTLKVASYFELQTGITKTLN